MKIQARILRAMLAAASVLILSSCMGTQTVMGEAAEGAGREAGAVKGSDAADDGITICVDAGHGFDDIGTSSSYLGEVTEKDITLEIALNLKKALEEKGLNVILTHDGEVFPETKEDDGNNLFNPQERVAYANTLNIDYFLSIHCDSYDADHSVRGTRIYYSDGTKYTKNSARAASAVCDAINTAFPDAKKTITKEMKKANAYYVIRETKVPSSLIEVGFVTNKTDASLMLDSTWCSTLADAIAQGIAGFFAE